MDFPDRIKAFINALIKIISGLFSNIIIKDDNKYKATLVEQIAKARIEWQNALIIYNEISERELIDYAIYNLKAAEEYYLYLNKLAKKQGVQNFNIDIN